MSQIESRRSATPDLGPPDRTAETLLVTPADDLQPVISVVLPTLNEEEGITECIDWIREGVEQIGLPTEIIVSDSSSDRTPELAEAAGARVVTPDEDGYGYAYTYGFEHARGRYLVIGDADTTYDFSEFPRLLEHLVETGADIVLGSRFEGEIKPGAMPALHRYVGNPVLTRFLNTFYDAGVTDAHSGFRVIRREALDALDLETTGMEFASEMIMAAAEADLVIEEVPITYHDRRGEATLDSLGDGWRHMKFMLTNAPGYLFSGPGVGLMVVGVIWMVLSATEGPLVAGVYFGRHTAIVGSLLTVVGYQALNLAIFSAAAADAIRLPRDPITQWAVDNVGFEGGVTAGLALVGLGVGAFAFFGVQWVGTPGTVVPSITVTMYCFTVVVLGVQTVFHAFFLDILRETRL